MFRIKERLSPPHYKEKTERSAIKPMGPPDEVVLPLLQHTGVPAQTKMVVGDKVKTGQLIADSDQYISAPIHASVSGEVQAIENRPHPVLDQYQAIVIASSQEAEPAFAKREDTAALSQDAIRDIIRRSGIVGLGGAAFPTHVKLDPPEEKPVDSFILNGAECEPFLTADHQLMLQRPEEILEGMNLVMRALGISRGFIAIEENKPDVISLFKKLTCEKAKQLKIVSIKSFYPQGAEKQLIKTILNREVPPGGLPFDVGVVVNNVATAFAIYEAVVKEKPLYERVITVTGKIVKGPANLLVRIGTKVKDILDFCGGLIEEPAKVIIGGPMMGIAQYTLDVPVIKGTSGIIVFGKKEIKQHISGACIRCGRCLQVCPMGLNPSQLAQAIEKGRYDLAEEYHLFDCIECGICSYLCPANRNVVGLVKLAKQKLKQSS